MTKTLCAVAIALPGGAHPAQHAVRLRNLCAGAVHLRADACVESADARADDDHGTLGPEEILTIVE